MTRRRLSWALLLLVGCGTLATETAFPSAITTSGVGPFRQLQRYETGVFRNPSGQAMNATGIFIESASVAGAQLYYAAAAPLATPPDRAADLAVGESDWAQAEPRAIYRASSGGFMGTRDGNPVTLPGFAPGAPVLEASEAWEGGAVYDPCAVVLPDGHVRLYYAAAGGIGVAEAAGPDATFTRVGSDPISGLDSDDGTTPRSPAVVSAPDLGFLLYYDVGDGVRVAHSDDGLAFTPVDADPSTPAVDPIATTQLDPRPDDPAESVARMPGATLATMPGGRRVVRVYFGIPRDDDSRVVSMSASEDGVSFERYERASFDTVNAGAPRPWLRDDGTTILLTRVDRQQGGLEAGAVVMGITPANHHIADEN